MRKFTFFRPIIVLGILAFCCYGFVHKFYVSTTIVEYNSKDRSLQIISRIFIDDLEQALQVEDNTIRMAPDSDSLKISRLMENYFKKNLIFSTHDSILPYTYLGKEYKNDIAVCYLELPIKDLTESFYVTNTILFELFDTQQNIVHFKNLGERKSFLLHRKNKKAEVLFNLAKNL